MNIGLIHGAKSPCLKQKPITRVMQGSRRVPLFIMVINHGDTVDECSLYYNNRRVPLFMKNLGDAVDECLLYIL